MGCGIGVWLAALIVGLLHLLQTLDTAPKPGLSTQSPQTETAWSEEQVRTYAKTHHLVVLTEDEYKKQQQQLQTQTAQLERLKQTANSATPQRGDRVFVAIQPGLSLREIADLLNKAGVIKDANAFVNAASQAPRFVKAGVYALPVGADDQSVLSIITR
jgi:hypothetical protein